MDLEAARKSLAKKSTFSPKKIAFGVVACLVLVAGIGLRASHYFGETPAQKSPVERLSPCLYLRLRQRRRRQQRRPNPFPRRRPPRKIPHPRRVSRPNRPADKAEQTKPEGDAVGQTEQADLPGAGMILVSRKPVEVLASPSASAPAMYGFPAGRPFRVIGREGGFVQIQDLKSSASGWIDEAALAAPPPAPVVAAPSQSKPGAVNRKPATASADPKPKVDQESRRSG